MADDHSPKSIGDALKHARTVLQHADIDGWDVEARLLSEWATGCDRLSFITRAQSELSSSAWQVLDEALAKRLSGMPVHRIMGSRAFYGLNLKLSRDTLEPRPDTEVLVDLVLETIRRLRRDTDPLAVLDLGTGTGAIGLALCAHLPGAHAVLTDISANALEAALNNAAMNGLQSRVIGVVSDWFASVSGKYDIIVSNPPYIRSADIGGLDREVREHDPLRALDGGPDGLEPYRVIAKESGKHLRFGGMIAVEFGHDQSTAVNAIFAANGWHDGELRKDLGGRDRALLFSARKT
jgi:release factor glutamine methyltransferase